MNDYADRDTDVQERYVSTAPKESGRWKPAAGVIAYLALLVFLFWAVTPKPDADPTNVSDTASPDGTSRSADPGIDEATPTDTPQPTQTALGLLTWSQVDVSDEDFPAEWIEYDSAADEYVVYDGESPWRSVDGVVWTREERQPDSHGFDWFWEVGDWAIGGFEDSEGGALLEMQDGEWREVDLPQPEIPEVTGAEIPGTTAVGWVPGLFAPRFPMESGDVVMIPFLVEYEILWEEILETNVSWVTWQPELEVLQLSAPPGEAGEPVSLTMDVTPGRILFADAETGETVHEITTADPDLTETIADSLRSSSLDWDASPIGAGVWIRNPGEEFEYQTIETENGIPKNFAAVPEGGFMAYALTRRHWSEPQESRVWTSDDGTTWVDRGPLPFATGEGSIHDNHEEDTLRFVKETDDVEYWISTDAINWTRQYTIDDWMDSIVANFGLIAGSDEGALTLWVSPDGDSWDEVPVPMAENWGAAGDLVWITTAGPDGPVLWIGRFE